MLQRRRQRLAQRRHPAEVARTRHVQDLRRLDPAREVARQRVVDPARALYRAGHQHRGRAVEVEVRPRHRPVHVREHGPQRVARHHRLPPRRARQRRLMRHADARRHAIDLSHRPARLDVGLVEDHRGAQQPAGDRHRHAREATGHQHGVGAEAAQRARRVHHAQGHRPQRPQLREDVAIADRARRHVAEGHASVARQRRLDAVGAAQVEQLHLLLCAGPQRFRDRQRREDVPPRCRPRRARVS